MARQRIDYAYILEHIRDGVCAVDIGTRRFSLCNAAMCRMLGYSSTEMMEKRIPDLHRKSDFPEVERLFEDLAAGAIELARDVPMLTKGGTILWADISGAPMEIDGRPHLLATLRDVTERKQAEDQREEAVSALRASEERLATFIDKAAIAIGISKSKVMSFVNPRFLKMFGYEDPAEILGRSVYEFIPLPEHATISEVSIATKANPLVINEVETKARRRDGSEFWIHAAVSNVLEYGSLGFITDITSRKNAELQLERSEQLLRITLDTTADGILLVGADGRVSHFNRRFAEMWNIPSEILETGDDLRMIEYVKDMVVDPEGFVRRSRELYDGRESSYEEILLADGRVYERYTAPIMVGGTQFGRVWDFRDITVRKHAEEEARNNASLLERIFDTSAAGICLMKNRLFIKINKAFCRMVGYPEEELLGRTARSLYFSEGEYDEITALYGVMERNGMAMREIRLRRRDGSEVNALIHLARISREDRDAGTIATVLDVTDLKRAELALKESEEQYRTLVDNMQDAVFRSDNNGKLVFVTSSAARILGHPSPEAMIGLDVAHDLYFRPEDRERFIADLNRLGKVSRYELTLKRGDTGEPVIIASNSQFYRDRNGKVLGIEGVFSDITELKKAEEELRRSEAILRSLFNATPIGIGLLVNRLFVKVNESLCSILGYREDEILSQTSRFLFDSDEEYDRIVVDLYDQMVREGRGMSESRVRRKDGTYADVILCLSPFDPADVSAGVTLTVLDITERKRMQEEKTRLEEMLLRSQKMEAIGTMAGGIAHDFNNILSGIFGYSELSLLVKGNPPETVKYLNEVVKAAERARDLIGRILTFSRQSEPELKPIMPKYIVSEALKLLRASTPKEIEFQSAIRSEAVVMADPTLLHQMILNLCNNAIQSMHSRPGTLSIRLEDLDADEEFARLHPDLKPGRHVKLEVSDSGCGIPSEIMDRIFEPFFTTKPHGEGTGLGLSVVHGIVKKLGGCVTVYSEVGRGTSFHVMIPAVEELRVEAGQADSMIQGGTERILLVDDEEAIVNSLTMILTNIGYTVDGFTQAGAALRQFRNTPGAYDLVITDYSMPRMTGIDLAREIRRIRADIPMILSSGYLNREMGETAFDAGIGDILTKPVGTYRLTETIRKALSSSKEADPPIR